MNEQRIPMVPASKFSFDELASIYNETRVDYLVPMPMNALRLEEYVRDYDVDLKRSVIAMSGGRVQGIGMLGLRGQHAWITRLGVMPLIRRRGIGDAILYTLVNTSKFLGVERMSAEVIKGNQPARGLLMKYGFNEGKEYLILRRPPKPISDIPNGQVCWLNRDEIIQCLAALEGESWINARESMANAPTLRGMRLVLPDGSSGWVVFKQKLLQLTNILLHTEKGEPRTVGRQLLLHLHHLHKRMDTQAENIEVNSEYLPAFNALGYFEAFRRIELTQIF